MVSKLLVGSLRFTELQHHIPGLSHRVLTQTLRGLQRDGLVARTPFPEVPPRVEYALTALGRSLMEPIEGLVTWLEHHQDEIEANRERFDVERSDTARARDQRARARKERGGIRPVPRNGSNPAAALRRVPADPRQAAERRRDRSE